MPTLLYVPRFDETGASSRYRIYQFLDSFKSIGFQVTVKPLLNGQYLNDLYFKKKRSFLLLFKLYFKRVFYLAVNKSKFDLVLMDGELFPFLPYFFENLFLPKHFIVDQDDAIFHTYDQHKRMWVRKILGNKIQKVWKKSYCTILCSHYLKEKTSAMGVNSIVVLPTVVNADIYKPLQPTCKKYPGKVVIGWVGSPATVHFLDLIKDVLIRVAQKAEIVLYVIGATYHFPEIETYCVDWKNGWNELDEVMLTNEIDIGIMPLIDAPYERGKGAFKLIKYMACAKPTVSSPVGMNVKVIEHGEDGYLASNNAEWEEYLLLLIYDLSLRERFGAAGRKKMLNQYSLQVSTPIICNILMTAVQEKKKFHD